MKKFFVSSLALVVAIFGLISFLSVSPAYALGSGDFTYVLDGDNASITGYTGAGGELVIPSSLDGHLVTVISDGFCGDNATVTSLIIPDSVTTIGSSVFQNATSLISLTLGNSLTSIGGDSFTRTSITELVIPDSVTSIGGGSFNSNTLLTSLTLGGGLTLVNGDFFINNTSLASLTLAEGLITIGTGSFTDSPITSLIIPDSVTTIGSRVFIGANSLISLTLGNGLTSIGDDSFTGMSITELVVPDSVTSIGGGSFNSNALLTSLTLGDGLTSIDHGSFNYNPSLDSLILGNSLTLISTNAFSSAALTSVTIPDSVITIDYGAFSENNLLTSANFLGNAPTFNYGAFYNAPSSFLIYHSIDSTGFSTSTCAGYNTTLSTDIDLLLADKEALTESIIKGANLDLSNITQSLAILPVIGNNDSTVTWSSSNEGIISSDGQTINRPVDTSANIILKATIAKGTVVSTKSFNLMVLAATAPIITTSPATLTTKTTVTLNASISDTGGEDVTTRGFNYGLTNNYSATTTEEGAYSIGSYSSGLSALTCGTTYHYRAYAINSIGTAYSDDMSFTTSNCSSGSSVSLPPAVGSGASSNQIAMGTTANIGTITDSGTNILAYINSQANFQAPESSNGNQLAGHSLSISNLDLATNIITLTISSTPQTLTMQKGETKLVDLDGDGVGDIEVAFANIYVNRAEVTVKALNSQVATTETPVVATTESTNNTETVTQEELVLTTKTNPTLIKRLAGRILLQVETKGQAWYLDKVSLERYYLADGPSAYQALRKFGLGITNTDLAKIPVAPTSVLPSDYVKSTSYSTSLTNRLLGRIVLQVENHGEAWYINPTDGYRYYLANGDAAYLIMRNLSLGITNANLHTITVGEW